LKGFEFKFDFLYEGINVRTEVKDHRDPVMGCLSFILQEVDAFKFGGFQCGVFNNGYGVFLIMEFTCENTYMTSVVIWLRADTFQT